jgi:hypothetical protein
MTQNLQNLCNFECSFPIFYSFFSQLIFFQLNCLKGVLVADGLAIIVAPSRHGTFEKFSELVRIDGSFSVEHSDNYSDKISKIRRELTNDPRFDENLQFPKLLKLRKLRNVENWLKSKIQKTSKVKKFRPIVWNFEMKKILFQIFRLTLNPKS